MAESILFGIAESLIEKLASCAYKETSLVLGVYKDLREIKQTLSFVKAVLLDAEQKQEHNHELQEWLRQIKHVFSDADDVLDEFECETSRKQVIKAYGSTKTKVGCFFSSSNPLVFRYRMARQIKKIKKRLDKVAVDRHKFGLEIIDVDRRVMHRRDMTYSYMIDSDVIGREHDKEKIIELLMNYNRNDDDKSLSIIPIVGIGGLGKTTLAKYVFNDRRIDELFPLKMWVCASDDFDIKQVIIKIINSAIVSTFVAFPANQQNFNMLDMEQLQNHLRNKLSGQKFLLVLDDIWNDDRVKWIELRSLIENGVEGCKVLVTTRSHSIASMMSTVPSYILEGLSDEDSVSLFIKWAFKEGEETRYPHLVEIGKDIVKKCKRVPLAIRTLGSSLFSKHDMHVWQSVRDNEIWNLPQKKDDILPALKLSYDQMPSYLRQWFALFSLYPKDYTFFSFEVTFLWGALGLLPSPNKNETWVDVTNQYLYELLSRSFLHDFVDYGPIYAFKLHDLLHDLALYVAKDDCLVVNSRSQIISENVRHLSFSENDSLGQFSTPKSGVRTILFSVQGVGANNEVFLNTCVSRYKFLRVLDLSDSTYENLPHSIGKLKHLRYLSLMNNKKVKKLPSSICKLQNLQVLILRGCTELETLPKGLRNLINLRHLKITTKLCVLPENDIANLSSLQNLSIDFCNNLESLFVGMTLPKLKGLVVSDCGNLKSLPLDIKHFPALETLLVDNCNSLELLEGHDKNSYLRLKLVSFVSLPQLVTLPHWLKGSVDTLCSVSVKECNNLEVLPEWLPTMTCLKTLIINFCPKLLSLPNAISCLTTLEHLEIKACPELSRKYQPQVGDDWPKIQHIKHIVIHEPEEFGKRE